MRTFIGSIGSTKSKLKKVLFQARRWQDSSGNTYHVVDVYVNGRYLDQSKVTYGYGRQYEQTGAKILAENGYYPRALKNVYNVYDFFRKRGIQFEAEHKDVKRKRDL